jgi:hypothetical protein
MAENLAAKYGGTLAEDDNLAAKYGGTRAEEAAPAPAAAAQASISQAFKKPAPSEGGGLLSKVGESASGFLSGAVSGAPFGVGPSVVAALSPETTEEVERDIAAARKQSPVSFAAGELATELPVFLTGAGAGRALATKAVPALTRAFPVLSRVPGALTKVLEGAGLGGVTGTEAAGRAAVEGSPASEALKTGLETGASMAALPATFAAAPALASRAPSAAGRFLRPVAPFVAPVGLAVESAPLERKEGSFTPRLTGDTADLAKWLMTQGVVAKGAAGEGFEKLAERSRESIQPKLRRATAEGTELAREDVYKDIRADETIRNQQFRNALKSEQRAMVTAEKIKQGDLTEVNKIAQDALDLDALVKGLKEGTDPSLRGLLGKLFQDVSNRLLRARAALENRPELANKELVEKINTVDRLITESYLKNTEKGGYLEDFNDDPYARLEVERQARLKRATEQRDTLAAKQADLLARVASRNYLEEARAQRRPPAVPEDVARQLAEKAGLEYAGSDEQFGKPIRHKVKLSPEREAELEAQTRAEFERQVAAGGRVLQGLAPEAEYGEKPKFMNVMDVGRARAATQPLLPDWVQPSVALRAIAGPVRALARAPESKFQETQGIQEARRPTETTMEKPYSTVAMLRAWDKVLERPSDATKGVLARVADRLGITYDKLTKTTAYRAAALEQALKDPEVAKEVMANVAAP